MTRVELPGGWRRFGWLLLALGLPLALFRAELQAGGYLPLEVSCPLVLARQEAPPADIIILGSSRSGRVIDPVFLGKSLGRAMGEGDEPLKVERLNSTGADLVSAIWTLEEYLQHRGRPKLIVLETMLRLKRGKGTREEKELFWPRHHSILPLSRIQQFRQTYESRGLIEGTMLGISDWFKRVTSLLHGLIKDPTGSRWNPESCRGDNLTRDGKWAWDEVPNVPAPSEALAEARETIQPWFDKRPPHPWKWGRKRITEAAYDVSAAYRKREVEMLREIVRISNDAGIGVLKLPLVNFATVVNDRDRDFFLSLGDRTFWYDVYADIGDAINSHHLWSDPQHLRKRLSPLVSAMLALEIERILSDG